MKKTIVLSSFLLLVGCTNGVQEQEEISSFVVALHPSSVPTNHIEKKDVIWELVLFDTYNNEQHKINLNDYGYMNNRNQALNQEQLEDLASTFAQSIDTPLQNASLAEDGTIIPGQNRVILSEKELVELIMDLERGHEELQMPIYVTEPNVKEEDVIGIDELVIGEYKTYFDANVSGRTVNIELSAEAIDRVILGPGDSFSFNLVVGERTVDRGYQEAMEIVNQEFVMGIGGGICQTSSTLFNAIDDAGLEIVERYTHSREIGYVPPGRDATVSWGGPDFKFKNPYPYPVILKTVVENGSITVQVLTNEENHL
ncbi:vancomycin resistance protein [Alkalihalobacillus alcalophilus ATCC 27647 = CGMCC 1.3604]|uniref:Vancomycin resistance protein n=1 Tax=Alkalihalobacillus alcalophilus ATCC 27647 = CGMCC 1.3604 TaxID=1218173 RepID=A0A094WQY6_ALKAL|nr:VanW family protein [Alkalihalobacillus alcalophilus]KGA99196.1 vancomycin resistance protein [Alkalihalobacillus alcalophilus ATCC 27647 = CGMCC 1.3604]MED1560386.1 VanW family protein [Alkalihalobacillus alcalophilus]THG90802.1 vancomycin resistance protein [Alkalihalobacillus alcalophilus ATCC 27647 = CGMCC 1.3604]